MAVKKCCIEKCKSCSTRKEDIGVTYHKFPKDVTLHGLWMSVTHHKDRAECLSYVCSRHFCKSDFQLTKDSKYVLKSDAVPSIFSWVTNKETEIDISVEERMDKSTDNISEEKENENNISGGSKESEGENLDAIKKFIEDQEKEIQELKSVVEDAGNDKYSIPSGSSKKVQVETPTVIASVMDLILNEAEVRIGQNKDFKDEVKQSLSPGDKANNSMSLSVGSKVEAKDFGDLWFSAEIVEVDYEEMEVLVHYENDFKKHDEWISVSSPRLRPMSDPPVKPKEETVEPVVTKEEPKETKPEDKSKVVFTVGEKCLARWRDNRRFVATIHNDLGNGKYEIIFDDGFHWTCNISRLHKYKPSGRYAELSVDASMHSPGTSAQSPVQHGGPSNPSISQSPPVYHTHLFDPTRDYLGTKSERREMKRKLNIKEIFNIGQKKSKIQKTPKEKPPKVVVEKKPKVIKRTLKLKPETELTIKTEVKTEIPDAVASIIGTIEPVDQNEPESLEPKVEVKDEINADDDTPMEVDGDVVDSVDDDNDTLDADISDVKSDIDPVDEEKLEKFDKEDDVAHEEVIDRIKEVINKLEDGLNRDRLSSPLPKISETPKSEKEIPKLEIEENPSVEDKETPLETEDIKPKTEVKQDPEEKKENDVATTSTVKEKQNKSLLKMKKSKKLRLLQEKKVKKEVAKVKSQLENWMKKQVEEMRKQMTMETQRFSKGQNKPMPESFMLPGEWCCRWVNGQPVGTVSEMESEVKSDSNGKPALPRRSVQVEDKRLPPGWTKHMVRRSLGHSAGKWDVVLVNPDNRRFHTKTDMRNYLENNGDMELQGYEHALMDFGVHLKLSRRMGWITRTPDGVAETPSTILPPDIVCSTSPLVKRKKLSLKKKGIKDKDKKRRLPIKLKLQRGNSGMQSYHSVISPGVSECSADSTSMPEENTMDSSTLEDGYVYVGSLKVQIIENLLRCPADGCFKNFRNNTLLKMHIKHYHRDLRKMMGSTPKVLDLAYARTMPNESEHTRTKEDHRIIKVKIPRPPKREEPKPETKDYSPELQIDTTPTTPTKAEDSVPRSQDSPKLRHALVNKPVRRPRVLLPVRRLEPEKVVADSMYDADLEQREVPLVDIPMLEPLDFEMAISTHTVTKPAERRKKSEKKRTLFATVAKSEEDEWYGMNSDVETMSSFPGSGTPDSKIMDGKMAAVSSESNEDQKDAHMYTYTENGERIKIVHMKREEIINCHCGFREEDGLMVQCELCLCWQHALCHNIQKESEVPEKYTCSICLNPWRGRASRRFAHSQERVYEGQLPGARACHSLRRAHELAGNLLRIDDALHALRVKCYVATKKDHPKLYLWAKDWEHAEITYTQEKLNSDYSDLNIMINTIGKENLPVKPEDVRDMQLDMRASPSEEQDDRYIQREGHYGSHSLLSGLLSSPGGGSLDLPISTSELERLAKTVQEQEWQRVSAPQPEAAIENSACRERLVRHVQRCQALVDARLDSIEAQVAELESQDPSFEDDETADYFPRTKQTIQMLMRDLDTMEELGVIT